MPAHKKENKLVSISKAAEILGISLATLRRWEKKGVIHCVRGKGNVRYFSTDELEQVIFSQPLSVADAAEKLGISQITLRRLEERGVIKPKKDKNGTRWYTKESIEDFLTEEYFLRKKQLEESSALPVMQNISAQEVELVRELPAREAMIGSFIAQEERKLSKLIVFQNSLIATGVFIMIVFVVIITVITALFIFFPEDTALFLGYSERQPYSMVSQTGGKIGYAQTETAVLGEATKRDSQQIPVLGQLLKPFTAISLKFVKVIDNKAYKKIIPREPVNVNDVLTIDSDGNIVPLVGIKVPDSSFIKIDDHGEDKNFMEYVKETVIIANERGEIVIPQKEIAPTQASSQILVDTAITQSIEDGSVTTLKIADGSVTAEKLAEGILGISDSSITTGKLAEGSVNSEKISDGAITGSDISDSAAIADSKLAQISATNKVAGSAVQLAAGGGLVNNSGLSLLTGCGNNQVLKWNAASSTWQCASVGSGGAAGVSLLNSLDGDLTIVGSGIVSISDNGSDTITVSASESDTLASVIARGATTSTAVALNGGLTSSSSTPLTLSSTTPIISIGNTGSLSITDGSNTLLSLADTGTTGNLSVSGTINGATLSGGSISGGSLTATAVNGVTTGNIVLTTGSYADPAWITSLAGSKISGNISGNAGTTTQATYATNAVHADYADTAGVATTSGDLNCTNCIGGSEIDESALSLTKAMVGLSNVENTAMSTWAGTANITTTGTLTGGATGAGFTLNFGASTLSGNITGSNIDESSLAGLTVSNFASANISQWTNNSGYLTSVDVSSNTNLSASDGITLTDDALTNTDKGSSQNIFKTVAVSGQSNVVSDANSDTLTFAAGSNITLTTDVSTDTVTISATGGGGGTTYDAGTDLDLTGTTFSLETTLDSVDTINLAGTGTLNGVDVIDATTESTIEGAIDTLANLTSASSLATVGTLTGGATGAGFTLNFGTSTLSGNLGGSNIDESTLAGLTATNLAAGNYSSVINSGTYTINVTGGADHANYADVAGTATSSADLNCTNCIGGSEIDESLLSAFTVSNFSSANISQWTNNAGFITDGNTNWDNSYGFITAASSDTLTNKTIAAGSNTISGITATNLTAGDFSTVITSGTYSIDILGNSATATNATTVTNGVYTTGSYANPAWITSLAGSKISGNISGNAGTATQATYATNAVHADYADTAGVATISGDLNCTNCIGGSEIDESGLSLTKIMVGLSNVENTALSTWAGTSNITTTGTLTGGATGAGFTLNLGASTLSGSIGGSNIDESTLAGLTTSNFSSANISQWTNNAGFITDGNTNWDNSYGFITAASSDTLTNKTIAAGSNTISGITAANLTAGDFSSVITSGTYGIDISGNAATATSATNATTVTNGVYTTGSYANPAWITSLAGSKVSGNISGNAGTATLAAAANYAEVAGTATTSADLICANCINGTEIDESGLSLTKTMVGLSNVENTALSTWAGTANITTTGTLTGGATGAGFTLNFGASTLSGNITGSNIDESSLVGLTVSNFASANISQWTNNSGYLTSVDVSSNTNLSASDGITLTDDALTNTDKGSSQNIFKTVAVSGQSNVVSDANSDTLTFAAGSNITLTTDASTDTVTIAATGGEGSYDAGTDLDLTGSTFSLETTLDSVDTINLAGTGTLNGLDAIDATTESTLESALDIGGDVTGTGLGSVALASNVVDDSELVDSLTYTGTLTIANNALAVNSDSITSDGTTLTINAAGNVAVQDVLSVSGGYGSKAALIVDQLNTGDILAASAAGTTRFRVDGSGNVVASGTVNGATLSGGSVSGGTLTASAVNGVTTADIALTSGSYADPAWITSLAKSKVGLGNVENTALSTWAGTSNITTTGTLTSGATGAGFTLNFGASTLSGNISGSNIDESTLAGLTTSNFSSANISQWTNNSGYITDGNTNWDNSYGFITASTADALTNKTIAAGSNTISGITASNLTAGDFSSVITSGTYGLDISGNAATASDLSCNNCIGGTEIDESTLSLTKAMVGLSNVENTALSTWAGTANITTVGTLTSGGTGTGFTVNLASSTISGYLPFANGGSKWAIDTATTKTLTPVNNTLDLLIGGSATSSAKFAVLGVAGNTPSASVSAQNAAGTSVFMDATGFIQSTRNNTLTLGGDKTGNIVISPNNGGAGSLLTISALTTAFNGTTTITASSLATFTSSATLGISATTLHLGGGSAAVIGTLSNDDLTLTPNGSGNIILTSTYQSGVRIGSSANTPAPLSVAGGIGSNAALIVSNTNNGDLFTASASATTKFTISNGGIITIAGGDGTADIKTQGTNSFKIDTGGVAGLSIGTTNANAITIGKSGTTTTIAGGLTVTAGQTITLNSDAFTDFTGNGLTVSGNALTINLTTSGNTGSTSSNSGLEVGSSGLTLLKGCSDDQLLKYTDALGWACDNDDTTPGGGDGTSNWTIQNGVLRPNNNTLDILFGGTATGSAKFAFMNLDPNSGLDAVASLSGNLLLNAKTNSSVTQQTTWTKISQTTAGTIAASGTTTIASISASTVYNGSLYVGTYKDNSAEVYRYDSGTTWTRVSAGAGQIASGGTSSIASVSAMTVYDGRLYVGTSKINSGEVYRYDGGTTWTKISLPTAGNFNGTVTGQDGIASLGVYQGRMYAGTREANVSNATGTGAWLLRYDGGTTWNHMNSAAGTFVTTNTVGVHAVTAIQPYAGALFLGLSKAGDADLVKWNGAAASAAYIAVNAAGLTGSYTINGTAVTAFDEVSALTVFNGNLVVGMKKNNGAEVLMANQVLGETANANSFTRLNNAAGVMTSGGTASIDGVTALTVYNGILYVGTYEQNSAEVYRYTGEDQKFFKVTQAAGTIASGGTASIDRITVLQPIGTTLYAGTQELGAAEIYKYTASIDSSYALKFHAAPQIAGGEQSGNVNEASIFYMASASANLGSTAGNTGAFIFSHGIQTRNGSYDVAEDYPTRDDSLEPGDVVAIDSNERGFVKKAEGRGGAVMGVYSEKPALRLTQDDSHIDGARAIPIALAGRVPVKVSTENGEIKSGDSLMASSIPGVAMKATKSGQIIGQAMAGFSCAERTEDATEECIGKVLLYVATGYFIGEKSTLSGKELLFELMTKKESFGSEEAVSVMSTDRLIAGLEVVTPKIIADEIVARTIKAETIEGLDILGIKNQESRIRDLEALFASSSAGVVQEAKQSNVDEVVTSPFNPGNTVLAVLGLAIEKEATVSGTLRVKENTLIEGILSVVDTMTTAKLIVNTVADFFGTVVFHGDVAFRGRPTFNSDTAGIAVIKKGENKVEVIFEKEYDQTPIVSANIVLDQITKAPDQSDEDQQKVQSEVEQKMFESGTQYVITRRTTKGFTILLNKSFDEEISFSWTALRVEKKNE